LKILLDTSALIAYYNINEKNHKEAADMMDKIRADDIPLTRFYVTDYILDETVTFIEMVLGKHQLARIDR